MLDSSCKFVLIKRSVDTKNRHKTTSGAVVLINFKSFFTN